MVNHLYTYMSHDVQTLQMCESWNANSANVLDMKYKFYTWIIHDIELNPFVKHVIQPGHMFKT